jgi:hypothetical protein
MKLLNLYNYNVFFFIYCFQLWENLSDKYLSEKGIPWSRVLAKSAIPTSRDSEIADQIHKVRIKRLV